MGLLHGSIVVTWFPYNQRKVYVCLNVKTNPRMGTIRLIMLVYSVNRERKMFVKSVSVLFHKKWEQNGAALI